MYLLIVVAVHCDWIQEAGEGGDPGVSGGQISTKHLKTSIRPFFATCRLPQYPEFWRCLPQYPEFWRCYRPRHTFLGPHFKRSLKSLDTMLKVPMRNTQLLPLPRKMVAVVLNIFFWGVYMFFI
jgi:hypothetical protein